MSRQHPEFTREKLFGEILYRCRDCAGYHYKIREYKGDIKLQCPSCGTFLDFAVNISFEE